MWSFIVHGSDRGMRVTVGAVVGLVTARHSHVENPQRLPDRLTFFLVKLVPNLVVSTPNLHIDAVVSWQMVNSNEFDNIGVSLHSINATANIRGQLGRDET